MLKTPIQFLQAYSKRDGLSLSFKGLGLVKKAWAQDYVYACKLSSLTGKFQLFKFYIMINALASLTLDRLYNMHILV